MKTKKAAKITAISKCGGKPSAALPSTDHESQGQTKNSPARKKASRKKKWRDPFGALDRPFELYNIAALNSSGLGSSSSSSCGPVIKLEIKGALSRAFLSDGIEEDPGGIVFLENGPATLVARKTGCSDGVRQITWDPSLLDIEGRSSPIILQESDGTVTFSVTPTEKFYGLTEAGGEALARGKATPSSSVRAADSGEAGKSNVTNISMAANADQKAVGTDKVSAYTSSITVKPASLAVKRDEIIDVHISAEIKSDAVESLDLDLEITPEDMRSEDLGRRGSTQMYDFGQIERGKDGKPVYEQYVKRWRMSVPSITRVTLTKTNNYAVDIKAVFNKAGTVRIIAKNDTLKLKGESKEITVTSRMRQYSKWADLDNAFVNDYDDQFTNANNLWSDWGHGAAGEGNYGLNKVFVEPEMIKSVAYIETHINPTISRNKAPQGDIMQVTPGGAKVELEKKQNDWNTNAFSPKTMKARADYEKGKLVSYTEDKNGAFILEVYVKPVSEKERPKNMGAGLMHYDTFSPTPVSVASPEGSIYWWMRQIYYKSSDAGNILIANDKSGGEWWSAKPEFLSAEEAVRRAGDTGQPNYMKWVKELMSIGFDSRKAPEIHIWPIKADETAR